MTERGKERDGGCRTQRFNWTITHLARRLPLAAGKRKLRRRFFSAYPYFLDLLGFLHTDIADAYPPMILRYAELSTQRSSASQNVGIIDGDKAKRNLLRS